MIADYRIHRGRSVKREEMKTALLIKAHFDTTIPLVNQLAKYVDIVLIFVLSGNRHTESIFDFNLSNIKHGFLDDQKLINSFLKNEYLAELKNKITIKFFHFPSLKTLSLDNIRMAYTLADYLKSNNFDLIHFNGVFGFFHSFYYFFTSRIPKVQTIHDSTPHSGEGNLKGAINAYLITRQNAQFIFQSHFSASELAKKSAIPAENINIVPYGSLPLTTNHETAVEDKNVILFFGRISPYKGLEYLTAAFQIVRKQIRDAKLIIAGSGHLYFNKKNILQDSSVTVINRYIPTSDLADYINKATIIAVPYTDASQSGVVMTAFAHEKPVVATNVGGIPEVVIDGETGILVPPKDHKALAEAIISLLTDVRLKKKIKTNIKHLCSGKLSWEKLGLQTFNIYKKASFL